MKNEFIYSEFRFVDTSFGGVAFRNNIVDVLENNGVGETQDCYTSMFRFQEEYAKLVKETGSVRGANKFACWSDYLWFDIDSTDLEFALAQARKLVKGLRVFSDESGIVCYFSGSKGFHIGIDSALCGFKPSQELPEQMRKAATKLAKLYDVDIDSKIYNHNRLWRIPNTIHSKTGFYKTIIPITKLNKATVESIKKLASRTANRNASFLLSHNSATNLALVNKLQLLEPKKPQEQFDDWEVPTITGTRLKIAKEALNFLLEKGVAKGSRDNEAILRASECRKVGFNHDECHGMLLAWNNLNEEELGEDDIDRIVQSAYTGDGYDFGTNHESLKEARAEAYDKKNQKHDDNNDEKTDEDYVRRPLSFKDITANPDAGKPPAPIGMWFTWEGRITLLVGREKLSGKSTLSTYECKFALDKGKTVLWISHDEPQDDIIRRFLLSGVNRNCESLYIAGDSNAPRTWKELRDFIIQIAPDIVLLDSIHSIFPAVNDGKVPDSSESAEWQKLTAKLRPIARQFNCAIVWIHHANKMGTSSGSIGIGAAVDVIVDLKRVSLKLSNCRDLEYLGRFVSASYNKRLKFLGDERGYEELEFTDQPSNQAEADSEEQEMLTWLEKLFEDEEREIASSEINRMIATEFGAGDSVRRRMRKVAKSLGIIFISPKTQAPGRVWTKMKKQKPSEIM